MRLSPLNQQRPLESVEKRQPLAHQVGLRHRAQHLSTLSLGAHPMPAAWGLMSTSLVTRHDGPVAGAARNSIATIIVSGFGKSMSNSFI